jgi:hypothetical protein
MISRAIFPHVTATRASADPWAKIVRSRAGWLVAAAAVWAAGVASALDVVGYTTTANDRFASGFPTAPVANIDPSFVGLDYDWSGVGWSSTDGRKGFGLVSPRHYLVAAHFGGGSVIRFQAADGTLVSGTQQNVTNTGFGLTLNGTPDLSLGRLTAAVPSMSPITRYAVLDLNTSSSTNSPASYTNQSLLVYGRGSSGTASPRVAESSISSASSTLYENPNNGYMISKTTTYTLEVGDSGSPVFIPWTNPNGGKELTIIGNNAAVDTTNGNNLQNFIGRSDVMNQLNAMTTPDGFTLRVVGNVSNTWVGSSSTNISNRGAWGLSNPANAPSDVYVLFNGTTAGNARAVTVDANRTLRGLYFNATNSGTLGFTFGGSSTLTVGRGGITNYDASRQVFTAPLALGSPQYWDVGSGGVTVGSVNTNGNLLEIAGSGTARITGVVSGSGGLALSGHRLELSGSSSFTGRTWVHDGTLALSGTLGATAGVTLAASGTLAGTGRMLAGTIGGAGMVGPGNSPGILTAPGVDPSGGLDFSFEFTAPGDPVWSAATASVNDVLRLTDTVTPFTSALAAGNLIDVYLGVSSLAFNDTFRGGFFTDRTADFFSSVQGAAYSFYVLGDGLGTARSYGGFHYYLLDETFLPGFTGVSVSTVSVAAANFAGGTVTDGRVMQFVVVPEPATWLLVVAAAVVLVTRRPTRPVGVGDTDLQ